MGRGEGAAKVSELVLSESFHSFTDSAVIAFVLSNTSFIQYSNVILHGGTQVLPYMPNSIQ